MQSIHPPEFVRIIISRLEAAGFEAYMAGGCVRDMLMGRIPHDWDVTTSALPRDTEALFDKTVATGRRHGTVTVIIGENRAEVTAFRTESAYTDHRRPDTVSFVSDLKEDLKRRDFTINAMAMTARGRLIDCFGGVADLEGRIIRCVGSAVERFNEDALRMLRALRFKAELGFDIEPSTLAAIESRTRLSAHLSPERVRDELCRILLSDRPDTMEEVIALGLTENYIRPGKPCLAALSGLPRTLEPRLCILCINLLRSGQITDAIGLLSSLRFERRTISLVGAASDILVSGLPDTARAMKRALSKCGYLPLRLALEASADNVRLALLDGVLSGGDCWSLKGLAVNGGDILTLGFRGKEIGDTLSFLLEYVIEFPGENDRNILLNIAKNRIILP